MNDIMFKKGLGRLVVADKDNDILGIITRTDLIESYSVFSLSVQDHPYCLL